MKYHYQYVSSTTVRIELIPEDQKEKAQIETFEPNDLEDTALTRFFQQGLDAYSPGAQLTKTNFMNFPKVALCSYVSHIQRIQKTA